MIDIVVGYSVSKFSYEFQFIVACDLHLYTIRKATKED